MLSGAGVVGEGDVGEVPSSPFDGGGSIDSIFTERNSASQTKYRRRWDEDGEMKGKETDIIKFGHRNGLEVRKLVATGLLFV